MTNRHVALYNQTSPTGPHVTGLLNHFAQPSPKTSTPHLTYSSPASISTLFLLSAIGDGLAPITAGEDRGDSNHPSPISVTVYKVRSGEPDCDVGTITDLETTPRRMTSLHPSELDTDSVASTPRSDLPSNDQTRVRFMCSFGGKILPRPHDNQLRYVGGDTRIVAVQRAATFSSLLSKLSKLSGLSNVTVKYQLPNEDLDALISVTTDEDVDNMMDEYDRITQNQNPKAARLRLFLFPKDANGDSTSRTSSISSLLDGSAKREHWFLDALNSGASNHLLLERNRSEASSILSEVPDYLFGLDNSDDNNRGPKTRPGVLQDIVSASDPGSPAPVISLPFCSTSSVPSIPNLPPVKTKPETKEPEFTEITAELPVSQATGFSSNPGNPGLQYIQDPNYPGHVLRSVPVYYYPAPVQPANVPVQPVQIRTPYLPQQGQIPVGYHNQIPGMGQVYGGGLRPVAGMEQYDMAGTVGSDGVNQQVYYGVRNGGVVPAYNPALVVQSGEEWHGNGSDVNAGRAPNAS